MSKQYINHESFGGWAAKIDRGNDNLLKTLHDIQDLINSLQGEWESDSARAIREKITGMEPRFRQYYDVVENYAKFLRSTADAYRTTEETNTKNANKFV